MLSGAWLQPIVEVERVARIIAFHATVHPTQFRQVSDRGQGEVVRRQNSYRAAGDQRSYHRFACNTTIV